MWEEICTSVPVCNMLTAVISWLSTANMLLAYFPWLLCCSYLCTSANRCLLRAHHHLNLELWKTQSPLKAKIIIETSPGLFCASSSAYPCFGPVFSLFWGKKPERKLMLLVVNYIFETLSLEHSLKTSMWSVFSQPARGYIRQHGTVDRVLDFKSVLQIWTLLF